MDGRLSDTIWALDLGRVSGAARELLLHGTEPDLLEAAASPRLPKVKGRIAVLPVHDVITQRGGFFGGTSTIGFERAFQRAIDTPDIEAVVLDVDSPGGTVPGVREAAERVFRQRGVKPVVAVANSLAASAAYWIASAAEQFVAAPDADVGSIGVFRMHEDFSEAMAKDGIRVSFIKTPEFKAEGNPFEPLSKEARDHHQAQVDQSYATFIGAVARHRNVTVRHAKDNFGRGRSFNGEQAARMGLVDRAVPLAKVLAELGAGRGASVSQAISDRLESMLKAEYLGINSKSGDIVEKRKALQRKYCGLDVNDSGP